MIKCEKEFNLCICMFSVDIMVIDILFLSDYYKYYFLFIKIVFVLVFCL